MSDPAPISSDPNSPRSNIPAAYAISVGRPRMLQHSPIGVRRYYMMHILGALFPITAGVLLFGWRSLVALGILLLSMGFATLVWSRIGARGRQLNLANGMWLALLLWMMLPAHLASSAPNESGQVPWPILAAAGFALAILQWLLGGIGSGRVHPAVVTYLLLTVLYQQMLVPHWVLQRHNLFYGDVMNGPSSVSAMAKEAWKDREQNSNYESFRTEPASQFLIDFTRGTQQPDRAWLSLDGLLRDRMPMLEDLIVGGQPTPIGCGSVLAIIIGGLFLVYRGLIDFRIPLVAFVVAYIALLILPVPVVMTDKPHWRWLAIASKDVNWPTAITFVHYELLASPMLFMSFFLATAPAVRPMAQRARYIYSCLLGFLVAVFLLYHSVSYGPYVAMLLASMITPSLDRWFPPRPLV